VTIIDLWLSVKRSKKHSDFALLVFTGPLQSGAVSLAFVKEGLDLTYRGLFYGPPRPKSYRLIVGRFDEAWPDFEKQKGAPEGILVPLHMHTNFCMKTGKCRTTDLRIRRQKLTRQLLATAKICTFLKVVSVFAVLIPVHEGAKNYLLAERLP
jgi:hypothetical protein